MTSARPTEVKTSAPLSGYAILASTQYPKRQDTVTAEVLARLLSHERLTSLDTVFDAGTTRLAAVIHYLKLSYGWRIEKLDKEIICRDGRVAQVAEYYLPPNDIAKKVAGGADSWCSNVMKASSAKRTKAAAARRQTFTPSAARKHGSQILQEVSC